MQKKQIANLTFQPKFTNFRFPNKLLPDIDSNCNLKKISNSTNIKSLIADKVEDHKYEFNIYLQGDKETVFFDI